MLIRRTAELTDGVSPIIGELKCTLVIANTNSPNGLSIDETALGDAYNCL